jgi:hypothetical protein
MSSSLYLGFEYLTGFYLGSIGNALIPQNLSFYRTSIDNSYVFWWTFEQQAYVPGLAVMNYELDIDTTPDFNSPNFQQFGLHVVQNEVFSNITANIFTANSIGSTSLTLVPNLYIGYVVQIVSGTGAGQLRLISSNTANSFTTYFNWSTVPDSTSVFIVYQSNVQNFQNGNVAKGYQIQVANRQQNPQATYYARVRTLSTTVPVSDYSSTLTFQLLNAVDQSTAIASLTGLPDYHIYDQEVAKLPLNQRNTLLWNILYMYGKQYDQEFLNKELTRLDLYLSLTRDEYLYDNWGIYFNFVKPVSMQYVDYRLCLIAMVEASLEGSTPQAIINIALAFTGVGPLIVSIRDIADFFLTTIRESFVTTGTTNVYHITTDPYFLTYSDFITNSLLLVRDSATCHAVLTPNVDYYGDAAIPGFITTITDPAGVTLTAFYEESEPEPLLFDPSDGLTFSTISGVSTVNFTNYSGFAPGPQGVVFVSPNMWTSDGTKISKVTPSGSVTNYAIAGAVNLNTLAFDGTNLWGCDNSTSNVFKISLSGTLLNTYSTGSNGGLDIKFDGTNMWITGGTGISKITPSGSATLHSYAGGLDNLAFDGTNMWATDTGGNNIVKVTPSGSMTVYAIPGTGPYSVAFDGTNMWTGNIGDNSVTKVTPSGSGTRYTGLGGPPRGIAFDGVNMWTANYTANDISVIAPTGSVQNFGPTPSTQPFKLAWDGSSMWIVELSGSIAKATPVIIPGVIETVTFTTGSSNVTGQNTQFSSQLVVGNQIGDGQVWESVQFITNNVLLTLSEPWPGNSETVPLLRLNYTDTQIPPNHIWDKLEEAFGLEIQINNPGDFNLNQQLIENLINLILPAHIKVYYIFN